MAGEVNCIFTKVLIPFVEQEVGAGGVDAILDATGRSRDYLIAEHNWISLSLADRLVRLAMQLMGEPDEERWARRFGEFYMDWKPTHNERAYVGTYTMALGAPRAVYARAEQIYGRLNGRHMTFRTLEMRRSQARFELQPLPGLFMPRWTCTSLAVSLERYPTNWGLPRASVRQPQCAARGAGACLLEVRWHNPRPGPRFWSLAGVGGAGAVGMLAAAGATALSAGAAAGLAALSVSTGVAAGIAWHERHRRRVTERLRDIQGEEILYSREQLERKFRDLETKLEQLSLLIDLIAAVNATLETEKIYEQALDRLVHRMRFQAADLYLVDRERRTVRVHRRAAADGVGPGLEAVEFSLDSDVGVTARVARTGLATRIADLEAAPELVHRPTARALGVRSLVSVPLRVHRGVFGVLNVVSSEPGRFEDSDVELLSAVANQVALAVDRAESFQTIEELTRGLEDKVRVRTEQLRGANEALQTAYRDLQATQMQLIQREKMASVGQLVAGVAHELNNPIGFIFSNIGTLEDFVGRLRGLIETYRGVRLGDGDAALVEERWRTLKVDYALKYVDSMIQGIREGAERSRKIVRDLRVFARSQDDVWQAADLHEDLESSLTLLNHLLKDRITVIRRFGRLPPVECVRSQIDQVFLNLVGNAAQAIIGAGTITIETGVEDDDAVVTITDSGPGIPAEVADKIFDPFFTTKPVGEGTGLGLSISYEIVKKHGGELRADNAPGGGARFTVRLPVRRSVP